MCTSRLQKEQVVVILREAGCGSTASVAKRYGTSEQTIYTWRKRFGVLRPMMLDIDRLTLARRAGGAFSTVGRPRRPSS